MSGFRPNSLPNFPCVLLMHTSSLNIVINGKAAFIRVSPVDKQISYKQIVSAAGFGDVLNRLVVTYNDGRNSGYLNVGQNIDLVEGMFFNVVARTKA